MPNMLEIRPMLAGDIATVSKIECDTSPHPWRKPQFYESLERHHCYVMVKAGQVIGFAIYTQVRDESEILDIAVEPAHQGCGNGQQLLDFIIAQISETARRLFLEVRASNARAIKLYQQAGFAELCVRKNYYQMSKGSEDAIMMALEFELHSNWL